MKLKLTNISNLDRFFNAVGQCSGAVEMNLPQGGYVNLKSKLSQYHALATVFSGGNIDEIDITTHNSKDSERLFLYMVQGR